MTLTIQDLGSLGELLGSVAVLVTLVYLALQTRQNTRAIGAQLDSARVQNTLALNSIRFGSPDLEEALVADRVDEVTVDQARRNLFWTIALVSQQWEFMHDRMGLSPTYNKASHALTIEGNFRMQRSYEAYWERAKRLFLPEFVAFVEEQRAKAA